VGNQFKLSFLNLSTRYFSICLGILLCLAAACGKKSQSPAATASSCTATGKELDTITNDPGLSDSAAMSRIRNLYTTAAEDCRDGLIKKITDDLFQRAYRSPLADTALHTFYRQIINDPAASGRNKLLTTLRLAAWHTFVQGDIQATSRTLEETKAFSAYFDDTLRKSLYSLKAEVANRNGDMPGAAANYLKALNLAEKLKDSNAIAGISVNFANVYSKMREFPKSIALRKKAEPWFLKRKDQNGLFVCWMALGYDYGSAGQYDSARVYNSKCLEMLKNGYQNPIVARQLYSNVSGIALVNSDYDTARFYFDKEKEELEKLEYNPETEMNYLMASTVAYAPVRDVSNEIRKIADYIPVFAANNNITQVRDAYYCLYHIHMVLEQPAKALKYYQQWDSVKNVLSTADNQKYVAELDTKYQTAKKELTIQVQQKTIANKTTLNILLMVLLGAGVVAAAFIISRVQLRRNRKEAGMQQQFTTRLLQNTEEERGRIARDLHDSVSQELLVLKNQVGTAPEDAVKKVDSIINEIRMISRNLHPVMLDQIGLKHSIEHVCNRMMEHNQLFISSDISYSGELNRNSELQLFRMIQEALNNTVKHAGAEAVNVRIHTQNRCVITTIRDNGKGFDPDKVLKGKNAFGLLSIIERSKSVQGKAEISSGEKGTVITIEIPFNHV
jgi:signal transduction histidine kinase/TPR repeat protein